MNTSLFSSTLSESIKLETFVGRKNYPEENLNLFITHLFNPGASDNPFRTILLQTRKKYNGKK